MIEQAQVHLQNLSDISRRFTQGGKAASKSIAELQGDVSTSINTTLHQLAAECGSYSDLYEVGAKLLCTAVRVSEFVFSKSERLACYEAFYPGLSTIKEPGLKGRFLGNFGNVLADSNRLDESGNILRERLDCAINDDDPSAVGIAKEHLGKLLLRRGNLQEADELLAEAFAIAKSLADESSVTRLLKDMSDAAFRRNEAQSGIEFLQLRVKRSEESGDDLMVLSTCQHLAGRLTEMGQFLDAGVHANRALLLAKKLRLSLHQANVEGTLGNIAYEETNYEAAHSHFMNARRVYRKRNHFLGQAKTASSLGLVAWKQKKQMDW